MDFTILKTDGKAKSKKKSGGFQSMGLSHTVLRAILKKGYKVPTPIQRKAIPTILEGKNVIAMARTGSGKTATFLVPLLEKLKTKILKAGARALIFSPTRELAMQTMKFTKELSRFTGLKTVLILGGEKIEQQFAAMHESPDIIIATPGRFLHLVIEMDLKLSSIEYVVFDEADRLFEMGFQEQLQEVLNRLPIHRQTLLFSATLPKVVADFVRSGIEDPIVIRLDVDLQISDKLKAAFLFCRADDKTAVLLHLLKNVINMKKELTVIFASTKHHIEYLKEVLLKAGIDCSCIYSSLDQMARKINLVKFKTRKVGVLIVTDIAARGIDIPLLDNVINYHFPANPKLYVHRVGRVARAGRSGLAYSLIASDETPYLLDLHLFLGKNISFANVKANTEGDICGSVPQNVIDDEADKIQSWHESSYELAGMLKTSKNAYLQYSKSRPAPSKESIRRIKDYPMSTSETHPIFKDVVELERSKILSEIKTFRPNTTIFEIGALAKTQASVVMRQKRQYHDKVNISRLNKPFPNFTETNVEKKIFSSSETITGNISVRVTETEDNPIKKKKNSNVDFKDRENYLAYLSAEHYREKGLGLQSSFDKDAASAVFDIAGDDAKTTQKLKNALQWDRKKKKFVREGNEQTAKKMKTESGAWIPRSYKSNLYKKWQETSKIKFREDTKGDNDPESQFGKQNNIRRGGGKRGQTQKTQHGRPVKSEIKSTEEILKKRKRIARIQSHEKKKHAERAGKKAKGRQKNSRR